LQVFTTAFRKVNGFEVAQALPGVDLTLAIVDKWGVPLANGLYYVVLTVDGKRTIDKLLIAR